MLVVRPIVEADLDRLVELATEAQYGLTTLPPDPEVLQRRIRRSMKSFSEPVDRPGGETYLFVLEADGVVQGISGMVSRTGGFDPFWAYRREKVIHRCADLKISKEHEVLYLVSQHSGPSEIGSLFLSPHFRQQGAGRLLSLSRFIFMADYQRLFEKDVIAEMRGVVDADGHSPFWNAVGRHFFGMDFPDADYLSMRDKRFIGELMPTHPLYVSLLPTDAQGVIGNVHPNTKPALALLEAEGFRPNGLIDIFEAGPVMSCPLAQVGLIKRCRAKVVREIVADGSLSDPPVLLSNRAFDIRTTLAPMQRVNDGCVIEQQTADALQVSQGACLLKAALRPTDPRSGRYDTLS